MEEFLNKFVGKYRNAEDDFLNESERIFTNTIDLSHRSLGGEAFRPERALNAAAFDSVMVGLAKRVEQRPIDNVPAVQLAYSKLFEDQDYIRAMDQSTSDKASVETRITKAIKAFADV